MHMSVFIFTDSVVSFTLLFCLLPVHLLLPFFHTLQQFWSSLSVCCTLCTWCACTTMSPLATIFCTAPINTLFASTPLLHLILFCTRTCWHYYKCVIHSILIPCSSKSVQNSLYNGRFFLTIYSTFSLPFMTLLVPSPQLHRIATLSRYNFWY